MKIDYAISLISSALAFHEQHKGPVLQARQVSPLGNVTDALAAALDPMVYVNETSCNSVINTIGVDVTTVQCCSYVHNLQANEVPSIAAASAWMDGYCASPCRFQFSADAGQIVAGCTFKSSPSVSPAEYAAMFKHTVDIMGAVSCVKDPAGNYCLLTLGEQLPALMSDVDMMNPNDPELGRRFLSAMCSIPCGLQLLDAAQQYTGYSASAICQLIAAASPSNTTDSAGLESPAGSTTPQLPPSTFGVPWAGPVPTPPFPTFSDPATPPSSLPAASLPTSSPNPNPNPADESPIPTPAPPVLPGHSRRLARRFFGML